MVDDVGGRVMFQALTFDQSKSAWHACFVHPKTLLLFSSHKPFGFKRRKTNVSFFFFYMYLAMTYVFVRFRDTLLLSLKNALLCPILCLDSSSPCLDLLFPYNHDGTSLNFDHFIGHFTAAVTNAQIISKPLYLDDAPPKSSLPIIQPFKRHLHVPKQSRDHHLAGHSDSADDDSHLDGIPVVMRGKLTEVCLSLCQVHFFSSPNLTNVNRLCTQGF